MDPQALIGKVKSFATDSIRFVNRCENNDENGL